MHGSESSYIDEIELVERKFATKPSQMTTSKILLRELSTNRDVSYDASISSNVNTTTSMESMSRSWQVISLTSK